jgi:hypothetical protein
MNAERVALVDGADNVIAELVLAHEEDGWLTGTVVSQQFPAKVKKALDWYDEVMETRC